MATQYRPGGNEAATGPRLKTGQRDRTQAEGGKPKAMGETMNAKKCKALRNQADALSVDLPDVTYLIRGSQVLLGKCTRRIYKSLKKSARA